MKKVYFIKNIQKAAEIPDCENPKKRGNITFVISKAVTAVTLFLLVVGLANFVGTFFADDLGRESDENAAETAIGGRAPNGILTEIPRVVEKGIFEALVERIPKGTLVLGIEVRTILAAYYYPLRKSGNVEFYAFDTSASEVEIARVLGYWNAYIGWSDTEYVNMLVDYNLLVNKFLK